MSVVGSILSFALLFPDPYNLMIVCCKSFHGEMLFARHKNYNCRIHHVHVMF